MKKIKHIAVIFAVILSILISFDDSFSLFTNFDIIEIPIQSDCQAVSHHHHISITDHFFQKNFVSDSDFEPLPDFKLILSDQSIADLYLSSIWQPPKITC
jgi:hypothetical protein